jgi:hypothetical protein
MKKENMKPKPKQKQKPTPNEEPKPAPSQEQVVGALRESLSSNVRELIEAQIALVDGTLAIDGRDLRPALERSKKAVLAIDPAAQFKQPAPTPAKPKRKGK